jgi:hypothetical protein
VRRIVPTIIAGIAGLIVLLDFFFTNTGLDELGRQIVDWVTVVVAVALILGIVNVLQRHARRVVERGRGWIESLALVASMLVVIGFGIAPSSAGPSDPTVRWIFDYVYTPLNATIFSLLAFFVVSAAYRAFRVATWEAFVMLAVAVLVLIGQAPVLASIWQGFPLLKDWLLQYPMTAAMRAIVIGVSVGAIATSLRVIAGVDRYYIE